MIRHIRTCDHIADAKSCHTVDLRKCSHDNEWLIDTMEVYTKLEEQDVLIGVHVGMNRVSLGKPEMNEKFLKIMKEILK